jgi:hypothetical protein
MYCPRNSGSFRLPTKQIPCSDGDGDDDGDSDVLNSSDYDCDHYSDSHDGNDLVNKKEVIDARGKRCVRGFTMESGRVAVTKPFSFAIART